MKKVVRMENWQLGQLNEDLVLWGYVFGHPKIGDSRVRTSTVKRIYRTAKGQLRAETWNTIYRLERPSDQLAVRGWAAAKTPEQEALA